MIFVWWNILIRLKIRLTLLFVCFCFVFVNIFVIQSSNIAKTILLIGFLYLDLNTTLNSRHFSLYLYLIFGHLIQRLCLLIFHFGNLEYLLSFQLIVLKEIFEKLRIFLIKLHYQSFYFRVNVCEYKLDFLILS